MITEAPTDVQAYRHMYVHVPFCSRRCSYCDFSIAVRSTVPVQDYIRGVARELALRHVSRQTTPFDTLYFGGGTPSRLGAGGVAQLVREIGQSIALTPGAEITLEANPEDITADAVRAWKDAGINRLSIGVQSFDDHVLTWMHRVHTAQAATTAIQIARDGGIHAFSLDLIFALPTVLKRDWAGDLQRALQCKPDHISLYGLTIEPHTPLGRWQARGDVEESPEEQYEEQFLLANTVLGDAGYEHYEVSNFALPGKRAVHNSAYWRGVPYLGVGPAAHGYDGTRRRWNIAAYAAWLDAVTTGTDPEAGAEVLTEENRTAETVYLGLRTGDGLKMEIAEVSALSAWFAAGWLEEVDSAHPGQIRCTPTGWLRLDSLAADLTALRSHS